MVFALVCKMERASYAPRLAQFVVDKPLNTEDISIEQH